MDNRIVRDRIEESGATADLAGSGVREPGPQSRAGRVVNDGHIPTTVPNFFAVTPTASVSGNECEACSGMDISTDGEDRDYVYVIGPRVPAAGDGIIYHSVGDRWVAQCDAPTAKCHVSLKVIGCGTLGLPGASYVLSNQDGSSTGVSGTTDDHGLATFNLPGDGFYVLKITHDRFEDATVALSCPPGQIISPTGSVSGYAGLCASDTDAIAITNAWDNRPSHLWTNPENAQGAPDGTLATIIAKSGDIEAPLKSTQFNLPVPANATLSKLTAVVTCKSDGPAIDKLATLVIEGAPSGVANKATGQGISTTGLNTITYEFTSGLPTAKTVARGDFGFEWTPEMSGSSGSTTTTYGPRNPGSVTDDATTGSFAWSNPGNAAVGDTNTAQSSPNNSQSTHYLNAQSFDFSDIPDDATPTKITVNVYAFASSGGTTDHLTSLVVGGTIQAAVNRAVGTPIATSLMILTYEWTTLLPTVAQLKAGNFGVAWAATSTILNARTISVDDIEMTVEVQPPAQRTVSVDSTEMTAEYGGTTDADNAIVVKMNVKDGYQCLMLNTAYGPQEAWCAVPLANTLHLTDSAIGSATLAANGQGAWKSDCLQRTPDGAASEHNYVYVLSASLIFDSKGNSIGAGMVVGMSHNRTGAASGTECVVGFGMVYFGATQAYEIPGDCGLPFGFSADAPTDGPPRGLTPEPFYPTGTTFTLTE